MWSKIKYFLKRSSSNPSDSVISVGHLLLLVLVINCAVTVVLVLLHVDGPVDDRLHHVHKKECRHCWEHESGPVAR